MSPTELPERHEPWRSKTWISTYYGISVRTVERWMYAGCPSRLLGGVRRLRVSDVEHWLNSNESLEAA